MRTRLTTELDLGELIPEIAQLADLGELAYLLQHVAARVGKEPTRAPFAVSLCALAKDLRAAHKADEIADLRRYFCMSCNSPRGAAPVEGCSIPFDHYRADRTRFAELPPTLYAAVRSFQEEHFGLPWYVHAFQGDDVIDVRVHAGLRPEGLPERWCGFAVTVQEEVRRG